MVMKERSNIEEAMQNCISLEESLNDSVLMIELAENEENNKVINEEIKNLNLILQKAKISSLEVLLSGEADKNATYLEIHPGAGGTESQDWAEMLLRMYIRWGENKGYSIDIVLQMKEETHILWNLSLPYHNTSTSDESPAKQKIAIRYQNLYPLRQPL